MTPPSDNNGIPFSTYEIAALRRMIPDLSALIEDRRRAAWLRAKFRIWLLYGGAAGGTLAAAAPYLAKVIRALAQ